MTGDRLLEVDGTNLKGVTHQQAVECLKKTGEAWITYTPHTHTHFYSFLLGMYCEHQLLTKVCICICSSIGGDPAVGKGAHSNNGTETRLALPPSGPQPITCSAP